MLKRWRWSLLLMALAACRGDPNGPLTIASMRLVAPSARLLVGETMQLTATPLASNGQVVAGSAVAWATTDASVAAVSASGQVVAVAPGTVEISAEVAGITASRPLTVVLQPSEGSTVSSLSVAPSTATVAVGGSVALTATIHYAAGTQTAGATVAWSTSDPATAQVSSTGVVTGVAAGTATITAASGDKRVSATVSVAPVAVASVQLSSTSATLTTGQTTQLSATPVDADGNPVSGCPLQWSTSNGGVATVSPSGVVTGVAPGTATITATCQGQSASATVTVSPVPATVVTVSPATASVAVGATVQLSAQVTDADGNVLTGRPISWSSENTAVATVSASGLVQAKATGTVVIRATSDGKSETARITVTPALVASIQLAPTSASVTVGQATQLQATLKDADGNTLSGRAVVWASSAPSVATVSASGVVTGVAAGTATITVTCDGQIGVATVAVEPAPVGRITITAPTTTLLVGETSHLGVVLFGDDGVVLTGRAVVLTSSNSAVAGVSSDGLVVAASAGTATITATSEGKSASVTVTVSAAPVTVVPVAAVAITAPGTSLVVGATVQLSAQVADADGNVLTGRSISWSTSDGALAAVSASGVVTALGVGTVTITATSEGRSASATVRVDPVPVASVSVTASAASLLLGGTMQLSATLRDADGNVLGGRSCTWSTSNSLVASISATGVLTGLMLGTVTVSASCDGKVGSTTVLVVAL